LISKVYGCLFERYKKKGANFYFKAHRLEQETGLPSTAIGRACKQMYNEGKLECWKIESKNSSKTWRTIFCMKVVRTTQDAKDCAGTTTYFPFTIKRNCVKRQ